MMRSQGLPMNFIVLAIIAILILLLILFMVLPTFTSGTSVTTQTKAAGECNARCSLETQYALSAGGTAGTVDVYATGRSNSPYCSLVQTISGIGNNIRCDRIIICTVEDKEGDSCKLNCTGSTAICI